MRLRTSSAFTIVELLVVIVVIAILAAIVIVSYNGITERTVIAALSSDLKNSATKLELGRAENSAYTEDTSSLPKSPDTTYQLAVDNSQTPPYYCLTATSSKSNKLVYHISNTEGKPTSGACPGHHGPIVYTYDFTLTGSSSTSSSIVNYAFTWDRSTITSLQYQEYWLYNSCTGPGIIATPEPNNPRTATGNGSATSFLSWGNGSVSNNVTAALWVRARPVDSNGTPLADWSSAKGVAGKQGSWNTCNTSQSPWQTAPAITATVNNATVSNLASSPNMQASITHSAVTTAPVNYIGGSGFTATNYTLKYEKIVYMDSGCVGSSPLIPPRDRDTNENPVSFSVSSAVSGISLSNMRIGLAVSNPQVGAVWARTQIVDSSGAPLTSWSAPYGVMTVYNLSTDPKQVSLQVCDASNPPPAAHWPSAR